MRATSGKIQKDIPATTVKAAFDAIYLTVAQRSLNFFDRLI
jgi:hypothetical protein